MLPFAIPYPPEQSNGFWGAPTSTIDWCEENYVVSPYVAEALNTVTNAGFIFFAGFAIVHAWKNKLEMRFLISACGFLLVGVGSWLFHMTLRYEYQLLDELPMIYATCIPFWSVFSELRDGKGSLYVGVSTFVAANLLTWIYLKFKDPTIHQAAYGLMNAAIVFRSYRLTRDHVPNRDSAAILNRTMFTGVLIFGLGYILWNMDIHLCEYARAARREVGMPYGFLLEGHGWWHLLTGTGVYFYLVYEEYLRCWLTGTQRFYLLERKCFLPVVVLKNPTGLNAFKSARYKKEI
ncbi:alkaline phytoceramidase [Metschnikowia bicuspidata var. bicuspidata NRRL YB-4993]|uniref:Alkaline phytoceramidase n=1 Tax=Metschnikowia bicuspidata var. bicuspidata NRRL YB-4993 TaxID=869754 RepID=A0A1A0H7I8_9ASCO|nr:alkaline phytoceramidase [Metschnikowia bicuspidata var. bicuspidata NRRL YB-4993]OBA19991.1 alkaline phytoceramidase [Metschnikowia bicuspidata var. bicuspidata NRRL YB-4993]